MRLRFTVVLLPAAILAAYATKSEWAKPPEYETLVFESSPGQTVYGLRCKNGGTDCAYQWDALCREGKAENADPAGRVQADPSYSQDAQGRSVRMYVCR